MSVLTLPEAESLLNVEIVWLKKVRDCVKETGDTQVEEELLEEHLGLAKELLTFLPPNKKFEFGSDERRGVNLIRVI